MNSRTLILVAAVALLGVGLMMTLADLFAADVPEQTVVVGVANQAIDPYQLITEDMIQSAGSMTAREARERALYPLSAVPALMSTDRIAPGDYISSGNALPPEEVRFTEDQNLEIISFQAPIDRLVGGQLRPGHIINLYGTGRDDQGGEFSLMVADRLWVVRVSAGGGVVSQVTAVPNLGDGSLVIEGDPGRDRPSTTITVAVPPATAATIIEALGARGLEPYVTLAANQSGESSFATSVSAAPTDTPGLDPNLALTATALYEALRATPVARPAGTGGGTTR